VADEAYYLDGSRNQQGPVPIAEIARLIRSGTIRRYTLVWYAGMPDWRPASQVNELASFFAGAAPPPRPPAGPPRPPAGPSSRSFQGAAPMGRPASMAGRYQAQAQHTEGAGPVGFGGAIARCFSKYVDFTGRAPRSEYWWWHLFYWLAVVVLLMLDGLVASLHGSPVLTLLALLALFLPTLAGTVRRLHDTDHSGWMILIAMVPLVGPIIYLVFMCQRGTAGPNRFGPDPLGADLATTFD
jgi:uncharacterized membrane protein YhaH (DUF805 family)